MYAENILKKARANYNTTCNSATHKNKILLFKQIKGGFDTDKNLIS